MMAQNELEHMINKLIDYVEKMGYHGHKNNAERLYDGRYIKGEPYDYDVFLPSSHMCFDAKETMSKNWQIRDKDIRQAQELKRCKNAGCDAFFLIYFYQHMSLVRVDVDKVLDVLKEGRKHIKYEECEAFEFPI